MAPALLSPAAILDFVAKSCPDAHEMLSKYFESANSEVNNVPEQVRFQPENKNSDSDVDSHGSSNSEASDVDVDMESACDSASEEASDNASGGSSSEDDATSTDAADEGDDGFETVKSKSAKRKAKKSLKAPPPAKRVNGPADSPPRKRRAKNSKAPSAPAPMASPATPAAPGAQAARAASQTANTPAPTNGSGSASAHGAGRVNLPPPIIIHEKKAWSDVSKWTLENGVQFESARSIAQGIRVQVLTTDDHRRLTAHLRETTIGYHSYALEDERQLRVVLKGIPKEIETETIFNDLSSQDLPIKAIHRMSNGHTKKQYDMVLAILDLTPEGKKIFKIKSVCQLTGIKVALPYYRGIPGQCHNCQFYGHSAKNCHARPRCVKCVDDHATRDCPRKVPDPEVPPSCILCLTQGHPANYRGCPRAPRKRTGRDGKTKRGSMPHRQAQGKTSQSAQPQPREKFIPAPAPATNAWDKPLPSVSAAAAKPVPPKVQTDRQTKTVAPKPAPPARTQKASSSESSKKQSNISNDINLLIEFMESVDLNEVSTFAAKLRKTDGVPTDRLRALGEHVDLFRKLARFQANK